MDSLTSGAPYLVLSAHPRLLDTTHRRNPELINYALLFIERIIVLHNREAYQSPKEITSG